MKKEPVRSDDQVMKIPRDLYALLTKESNRRSVGGKRITEAQCNRDILWLYFGQASK